MLEVNPKAQLLIQSYAQWIEGFVKEGWVCHLMTFMFNPLKGNRDAVIAQMSKEVERVYSTLLTRVHRDPHSPKVRELLPKLIGFPDLPVFKHRKDSLGDITTNDGLHFHAILLLPPISRLKQSLGEHIRDHENMYLGKTRTYKIRGRFERKRVTAKLQRIDVQGTEFSPANHASYGLKGMKRLSYGHLLALPKAQDERSPRSTEEIAHSLMWW